MSEPLLHIDRSVFNNKFDRRAFSLRHRLTDHPLFAIERLVELAQTLPSDQIEYNAGDLPVNQDPDLTPQNGLSAEETVQRIEHCDSWLVLKRVESDPDYRVLLDQCLDEIRDLSELIQPNMHQREGFIFVSSPGAVTPYHMDPELNFLLQIRGSKVMRVWDPADRVVISELDLEDYFSSDSHRNLEYRDEYARRCDRFELTPGLALHVPMAVPHWVKNGDGVSVSFSITFRTAASRDRERLYQLNARLRSLGLSPHPVGASASRDAAKLGLYQVYHRARRILRSVRA